VGDLPVRETLSDQSGDLEFAAGQGWLFRGPRLGRRWSLRLVRRALPAGVRDGLLRGEVDAAALFCIELRFAECRSGRRLATVE
jgi:hypothetical protein